MTQRKRPDVKPRKIMDSAARDRLRQAQMQESMITSRVFELVDTYINKRTNYSRSWLDKNVKFEHAPDWLRPIAALSFRLGVNHEDVRTAVLAGQRGDWTSVDMVLMAHES